jgi:catechol 2,3-dioxygenase
MNLGLVSLTVSNMARALRFYEDLLGLELLQRQENRAVLGVEGTTSLLVLTERSDARPKPPHTTGLYHYAILLPRRADLARALRRLAERRYLLQGAADHGVSEALYLADPDGNGIEIYADRLRSAWPRQNEKLQMRTDPLDVEDLFSELDRASSAGDGLPPGTCIGHIHLHVADLARAETFYRELLGFDLMQRYGSSALFLSAGGYHHHIGLNTWAGAGAPPPPPDAVGLRYFTVDLPESAELARVAEHLRAAGVPFERQIDAPQMTDGLVLNDPSGNGILLRNGSEGVN